MSILAELPVLGPVDRAPYQLTQLLRQLPENFSFHNPMPDALRPVAELVASHASNANDTIMHGLAALGQVIMTAALNEEGEVTPSHLARLGDLITHLAVEAEAMQELGWMISEALEGEPKR